MKIIKQSIRYIWVQHVIETSIYSDLEIVIKINRFTGKIISCEKTPHMKYPWIPNCRCRLTGLED